MEHRFGQRTAVDTTVEVGRRKKIHQGPTTQRSIVLVEEIDLHIDNIRDDGKRNEEALNHVIITEFTSFQLPS